MVDADEIREVDVIGAIGWLSQGAEFVFPVQREQVFHRRVQLSANMERHVSGATSPDGIMALGGMRAVSKNIAELAAQAGGW